MRAVLIGNPNCGKTTIYNGLTGSRLPVGNRPGVTVKAEKGYYHGIEVYDLPGVYSLKHATGEEKVVADALKSLRPDFILNVVDATRTERSLYLSEQLLRYCKNAGIKMVVLLNFIEKAAKTGIEVNAERLSLSLGCPVLPVARKVKNYDDFFQSSDEKAYSDFPQDSKILYDNAQKIAKNAIEENHANRQKYGKNFQRKNIRKKGVSSKNATSSATVAGATLRRYALLPLLTIAAVALTIAACSSFSFILGEGVEFISKEIKIIAAPLGEAFCSFLCDGILAGIGSVLQFLPLVFGLLVLSQAAEESGILTRIALLFDPFFAPLGLSGKSAVSFFLGCGCTVPAVLSTRTAASEKERIRCLKCVHFVPCSAKLPLCAMVIAGFTADYALLLPLIYLAALPAIVAVNTIKPKTDDDFIMEFPPLSAPRLTSVLMSVFDGTKSFIRRICTVVFCASVVVWVLSHYDFGLRYCDINSSMLAFVGNGVKYFFYPLGLYDWRMAVAILAGFAGKETAAGVLTVLTKGNLSSLFDPISATIFLSFVLFSPPCAASLNALRKELPKGKFLPHLLFQLLFAYSVCSLLNVGFLLVRLLSS